MEDVAGWYVFLASDRPGYATGSVITVDGGLDAQQMAVRPITEAERKRKPYPAGPSPPRERGSKRAGMSQVLNSLPSLLPVEFGERGGGPGEKG